MIAESSPKDSVTLIS